MGTKLRDVLEIFREHDEIVVGDKKVDGQFNIIP
jgi:hypothetical protein